MTYRNVVSVAVMTLLLVFALSFIWEFMFEDPVGTLLEADRVESAATHWEFVVTSMVFAAIAVFISSMATIRIISERRGMEEALRRSEMKFKDFAGDVAHELRTPLAVLKLHLDELEGGETAQALHKDVAEMSRMVEQLLAIARLDSSESLAMNDVDLKKICTDVAEMLAPLAVRDERLIEVCGADKAVFIKGNADALEHAVRNLVENALKYSSRRTTITIEVNDEPSISVINKGHDIPPEKRDAIFGRFQRSDRRSDGAGLGLSIVQRAVEAHKGRIEMTNVPGGGAKFTICLSPIR